MVHRAPVPALPAVRVVPEVRSDVADYYLEIQNFDDEDRFAELIDMGVTAVTTNQPARMLAIVGSRSPADTEETGG